ncbi:MULTISPECIES: DUF5789 family protein [Haloferacaceae]|uniref:DUF2795 domain-containing protein n=1 Tax=Halorubrum glutamatedens TaxID=2707018 RepID=A0ABD5QN18_9EURY|nr:hypothetical protein [Halobellus captivus]
MTDDEAASQAVYGVVFGPLKPALREHAYPVTKEELIEQYGGFELEHADGTDRLEEVLRRADVASFREPRQVRDAILGVVGVDGAGNLIDPDENDVGIETDDWSSLSP